MKSCPNCGSRYSDDLNFCLKDGTSLDTRPTNVPTQVLPAGQAGQAMPDTSMAETIVADYEARPPVQLRVSAVEPVNRLGCVITVGRVAAVLVVTLGLAVAAFLFVQETQFGTSSEPPGNDSPGLNTLVPGDLDVHSATVITFTKQSAQLEPDAKASLDAMARDAAQFGEYMFAISAANGAPLLEARSDSIANYLTSTHNIPPSRVAVGSLPSDREDDPQSVDAMEVRLLVGGRKSGRGR